PEARPPGEAPLVAPPRTTSLEAGEPARDGDREEEEEEDTEAPAPVAEDPGPLMDVAALHAAGGGTKLKLGGVYKQIATAVGSFHAAPEADEAQIAAKQARLPTLRALIASWSARRERRNLKEGLRRLFAKGAFRQRRAALATLEAQTRREERELELLSRVVAAWEATHKEEVRQGSTVKAQKRKLLAMPRLNQLLESWSGARRNPARDERVRALKASVADVEGVSKTVPNGQMERLAADGDADLTLATDAHVLEALDPRHRDWTVHHALYHRWHEEAGQKTLLAYLTWLDAQEKTYGPLYKRWSETPAIREGTPNFWAWANAQDHATVRDDGARLKRIDYLRPENQWKIHFAGHQLCYLLPEAERGGGGGDGAEGERPRLAPLTAGNAIYVMDGAGTFWARQETEETQKHFHHSSFLGGKAVAAAGKLEVASGVVGTVDSESGHYQPQPRYALRAARALLAKGTPGTMKVKPFITDRLQSRSATLPATVLLAGLQALTGRCDAAALAELWRAEATGPDKRVLQWVMMSVVGGRAADTPEPGHFEEASSAIREML
ncbi:MAG: hypothetical protein KC635_25740, partial [Myxococcales bacterium]|nr:hypothetical protein [Myxococcales bacterium]